MKPYFTYFIIFKSSSNDESIPIQLYFRDAQIQKDSTMHLFDNDLTATLDTIEYIMHLPRNVFDLYNLDENFMASSYDTPHWIILLPDSEIPDKFDINIAVPALFVLLDECDPQAIEQCKKWNPLLGVCKASDLDENLLKMQWEQLWNHYQENDFDFDKVPDMDIHFWLHEEKLKALPVLFLSRQYGKANKETYSVESLRSFIEENIDADILYISAHGYYQREKNIAGIMVGEEFWIAAENIRVPPIVILSACHVSPRGIGAVNIADMFIRNGAVAVLGNFIPVNAKRNLILMTRLFTYIAEAQLGNKQYKTLSDAWCGIVASNAIHELMSTSQRFNQWMHSKNREGKIRIIDFQLNRCVGKLRLSHVYSDTITIIKEMLSEEGLNGKFGDILDINNFFRNLSSINLLEIQKMFFSITKFLKRQINTSPQINYLLIHIDRIICNRYR